MGGSSWYYLRYIDPNNDKEFVNKDLESKWNPVDFYVGGAEHATRHLIYTRFWHKYLLIKDLFLMMSRLKTSNSRTYYGRGWKKMSKKIWKCS